MSRLVSTVVALALSVTPALAQDSLGAPHPGVLHLRRTAPGPIRYNAVVVQLCGAGLQMRATAPAERRRTPSSWAAITGVQVAVNADFYDTSSYAPRGLAIGAGARWAGTWDPPDHGLVAFGVRRALVTHQSEVHEPPAAWMTQAVGGSPEVVWNGEVVPYGPGFCSERHPRTAVGLSNDGTKLVLAVADGRQAGSIGATCMDMGHLLRELGASWAMNLDGGGSSAMWIQGLGVVNRPSDGRERVVANHLGVYANGPATASAEVCNGWDDDCDGRVDEGLVQACGSDVGECELGTQVCASGAWGACTGGVGPQPEVCDGLDNDCDGESDDERVCEIDELVFQSAVVDRGSSDVDGDGRADVCARGSRGLECHLASGHGFELEVLGVAMPDEAGWAAPSRYSTLRMVDVDGDGRADACARAGDALSCWRSSGRAFDTQVPGPAMSDAQGFGNVQGFATLRFSDVDGDGRMDACVRTPAGLRCHRSTGVGFDAGARLSDLSDEAGYAEISRYGTLRFGDIDGDGRDDVCVRGRDGVDCWRSTADGFGRRVTGPRWSDAAGFDALARWSTIRLADVDGDGRADLCARTETGFECHRADGRGFGSPEIGPALSDADGWSRHDHYSTLRMGDVDGDGALDVCARDARGVACWLYSGRGFERRVAGPALSDEAGFTDRARYRTIRLADVDGDGRADVCARGEDGLDCWMSDGEGFPIVLPGPAWTDADGWQADARFATIRIAGGGPDVAPALHGDEREAPHGGCRAVKGPFGAAGTVAPWLLALLVRGRRLHERRPRRRRWPRRQE